jgi:hypothetical protein
MDEPQPWHRYFGLSWMDFFRGLPVTVELEKDLSLRKQLLDVVIIRTEAAALPLPCRLPDGFEELARHNLISFKSYQEKLGVWTLQELLSHYVNYRKQVSPTMDEDRLLAEDEFRLFAVTARYPQQLANTPGVALQRLQEGVYEVEVLTRRIRIVVANQLPKQEHNALLHVYSARGELLEYGWRHYHIHSSETSTLLYRVFAAYHQESLTMPDLLEEFARQTIEQILKELPAQKRLEGLSAEERLKGLPAEDLLKGLSAEQREELRRLLNANGGPANAPGPAQ